MPGFVSSAGIASLLSPSAGARSSLSSTPSLGPYRASDLIDDDAVFARAQVHLRFALKPQRSKPLVIELHVHLVAPLAGQLDLDCSTCRIDVADRSWKRTPAVGLEVDVEQMRSDID